MAAFRHGRVVAVAAREPDLVRVRVALDDREIDAVGYPFMLGAPRVGDRVVVNTTGLDLGLGTGGVGFVLWNLDAPGPRAPGRGHIVKLRYTPWQTEVLAAEAPESAHHDALTEARSVDGVPVVACGLHSQVAGVSAGIKAARADARVGYLMTDGGALPLAWSDLVRSLRAADLIDVTATCGHAFGGDLEAVNLYSGLAALRVAAGVDAVVVAMGPGVVGTGTALGFSAIEQGHVLDAATALDGRAIACLRISFADDRPRHRGVSHHSLTALGIAARERCVVVVPELAREQAEVVREQLAAAGVSERHRVIEADGSAGMALLEERALRVASMGRNADDVPEPFLAAAAAGSLAGNSIP